MRDPHFRLRDPHLKLWDPLRAVRELHSWAEEPRGRRFRAERGAYALEAPFEDRVQGDMPLPAAGEAPVVTQLLIVFGDFNGYTKFSSTVAPDALFRLFSEYAVFAAARIEAAGGQLVKMIGDAALAVFPEDKAGPGVMTMLALKAESEAWMRTRGFHTTMVMRAHFGEAACGPFGADGRFDVYGQTVNTTARLPSNGFALSEQVYRLLKPEEQRAFQKHPLQATYLPVGEPNP